MKSLSTFDEFAEWIFHNLGNIIGLATDRAPEPGFRVGGLRNKTPNKAIEKTIAKIQQKLEVMAKKNNIKQPKWALLKGLGWVKYRRI